METGSKARELNLIIYGSVFVSGWTSK
jgi:hypothetical protein